MAVVHQLLSRFRRGEPATESALRLQVLLRRLGHWGELMALAPTPEYAALVRPLDSVRLRRSDWLLGHYAGPSAATARMLLLGCQRAMVLDAQPAGDTSSRAQLQALARVVAFSLAPSAAAASALLAAGHSHVLPFTPFVEADRFEEGRAEPRLLESLRCRGPRVVVSAVAPGTDARDVVAFHHELRRLRPGAQLIVLTEAARMPAELRGSWRRPRPGLLFLESRNHAEHVATLRSAQVFLSLSEEDLAGVELLEAMAAGVPVLAYAAGAVPEVLGGAGLAFTEKRFAFLAELCVQLAEDLKLRKKILARQQGRLARVSPASAESSLRKTLEAAGLGPERTPPHRRRPRVAVVVQRYGDVTGGAEALARCVVERLASRWDITVLTTCAKDHLTWENVFPQGASTLDGVPVRRFATRLPRRMTSFNALSRRLFGRSLDRGEEEHWLAMQGPLVPGLWRHLAEEDHLYDGLVAFTYLYASTAWSVPLAGTRTLLVPTAHDEPPLAFGCYREVFERPRVLFASTPEELDLIRRRFPRHARGRVVGAGIEAPARLDPRRFRKRFQVSRPYLLYVGRVEAGKGIPELLSFFAALRGAEPDGPDLLLAGDASMSVTGVGVRALGRISEWDKWDALAGALAVVVPSPLESLSLLALEAFAVGTPVVGNARGDVVRGQLERSGAGQGYTDAPSFRAAVNSVSRKRAAFGAKGRVYARKHRWTNVVQAYREEMDRLVEGR